MKANKNVTFYLIMVLPFIVTKVEHISKQNYIKHVCVPVSCLAGF